MPFREGYLTPRETSIWDLRRNKLSQSEIGRKIGVSRQAVHKAYQVIDNKVEQAFKEAAEINNLEMKAIDLVEGIMSAHSPAHNIPVIVSLSKANGLKVWYLYEGNCVSCYLESICYRILKEEAKERDFSIANTHKKISPAKLAQVMFEKYKED